MGNTDELSVRPLGPADIDAAFALNTEAGWNQVTADWRFMIEAGEGVAVTDPDGTLIATGMVLPYGDRFAWIAMILVTARWQRRGVATLIMRHCLETCDRLKLVPGLDATEQGRPVYLPLGFQDVYSLSRLAAERVTPPAVGAVRPRPVGPGDLAGLARYDAAVFGTDRTAVLRHLHERQPDLAMLVERDGRPAGYVMGRNGRVATQIGPLVADDDTVAEALLAAALSAVSGPVFLDLADRHERLRVLLDEAGFQRQRGYVRMLVGRGTPFDNPARGYIITGPEFG